MAEKPDDTKPSFFRALGQLAEVLASDLGRAIAVVGGLVAGFLSISKAQQTATNDWALLGVAGAIFVALAFVCRR
jgi:hypothetical protein